MDKKSLNPKYFELNPIFNGLKKDVLKRNSYQMNIDIFGDIQTSIIKVPIRLYLDFDKNEDPTDIKYYHLNGLIDTSLQ